MQVKALACELPSQHGLPLSRFSVAELAAAVRRAGLVATIGDSTIWRWLHEDAIRPWQHRCWIFPRDPDFGGKAGRVLDLYERVWEGQPLADDEFVLSTDEKTSIQARRRRHPTRPPQPGCSMRVAHEYRRDGAWAYLAVLDVHRSKVFGQCERRSGIEPFGRLERREGSLSRRRLSVDSVPAARATHGEGTQNQREVQCFSGPRASAISLEFQADSRRRMNAT